MLANGAALGYKETKEGASYTDLAGLKEIPEIGSDPEKVENTTLKDKVKQYDKLHTYPITFSIITYSRY